MNSISRRRALWRGALAFTLLFSPTCIGLRPARAQSPTVGGISSNAARAPQRLRIMCIGASITMGQGVNGGYRLPLEKMLQGAGIPFEFVGRIDWNSKGMTWPRHDGYPGHRIDQIEAGATNVFKIASQPIAAGVREARPDVVLLFCGTNDIRQAKDLDNAPARLRQLIQTLHQNAPNARLLVASITADMHNDAEVRRYNSGVAQVVQACREAGQKVEFVDMYPALVPGVDIGPDRTHPTAAGYAKIARVWFNALAPGAPQVAFAVSPEGANEFTGKTCSGYRITMRRDATVASIGIYTGSGNGGAPAGAPSEPGAVTRRPAGIFSANGELLGSVAIGIGEGGGGNGPFVFKPLNPPVRLRAGQSYVVASNNLDAPTLIGTGAIVDPLCLEDPRFRFDNNVAVPLGPGENQLLKFPGVQVKDINGAVGYFGPNLVFAPEASRPAR